ncbi:hypothetical protein SETIT_6G146500v2 [Setaria italica]|uniref:Uncharacterized protein n=1 Tax=Setaria italica TaxID=4555 RepID=A0A368RLZ7_SETIT|nr:hypothetical protein SETIT_6G146500v2 [Setaria italica]
MEGRSILFPTESWYIIFHKCAGQKLQPRMCGGYHGVLLHKPLVVELIIQSLCRR